MKSFIDPFLVKNYVVGFCILGFLGVVANAYLIAAFCIMVAFIGTLRYDYLINYKKSWAFRGLLNKEISLNYLGEPKENWRVVTAANRHKESGLIVVGARHFDRLMRAQIFALQGFNYKKAASGEWDGMSSDEAWKDLEQGFIDNYGDFLTREEAWYVADNAGQIINQDKYGREGYLYSENIH